MRHTGDVLKEIMIRQGLRQIDIVNRCQPFCEKYNVWIRKEDISQYISRKTKPNQERIAILAMALGVNEAYLMGCDVSPVPNHADLNEQILLDGFRRLTTANKNVVTTLINNLLAGQNGGTL